MEKTVFLLRFFVCSHELFVHLGVGIGHQCGTAFQSHGLPAEAVELYVESVEGGVRFYFMEGEAKKYIDIVERNRGLLNGEVKSVLFKGVHYEMFVDTDKGYELMIQDYNAFEPDSVVGLIIRPADIQVMHKERTCNTFDAEIVDETHVSFLGEEFECRQQTTYAAGEKVKVEVKFQKVELIDHPEEGMLSGTVYFLLYKGDHYHLTILTDDGDHIWVDTNDIWDKGDLVGINIAPKDIKIVKCND